MIIDALTSREPFREKAEQLFLFAANQIEEMYITASSATDIYYLVRKYLHSTEESKNTMSKLFELFLILDVTSEDCQNALVVSIKDYEDAVVSCCAERNKIDYIITRNKKDYECSKIKTLSPDEVIKLISEEQ